MDNLFEDYNVNFIEFNGDLNDLFNIGIINNINSELLQFSTQELLQSSTPELLQSSTPELLQFSELFQSSTPEYLYTPTIEMDNYFENNTELSNSLILKCNSNKELIIKKEIDSDEILENDIDISILNSCINKIIEIIKSEETESIINILLECHYIICTYTIDISNYIYSQINYLNSIITENFIYILSNFIIKREFHPCIKAGLDYFRNNLLYININIKIDYIIVNNMVNIIYDNSNNLVINKYFTFKNININSNNLLLEYLNKFFQVDDIEINLTYYINNKLSIELIYDNN